MVKETIKTITEVENWELKYAPEDYLQNNKDFRHLIRALFKNSEYDKKAFFTCHKGIIKRCVLSASTKLKLSYISNTNRGFIIELIEEEVLLLLNKKIITGKFSPVINVKFSTYCFWIYQYTALDAIKYWIKESQKYTVTEFTDFQYSDLGMKTSSPIDTSYIHSLLKKAIEKITATSQNKEILFDCYTSFLDMKQLAIKHNKSYGAIRKLKAHYQNQLKESIRLNFKEDYLF